MTWGPQYRSIHFQGSLRWLGMADESACWASQSATAAPSAWIKTLKEQCLWARLYEDIGDLRQAVTTFVETYNTEWLIQRTDTQTPREKNLASLTTVAA